MSLSSIRLLVACPRSMCMSSFHSLLSLHILIRLLRFHRRDDWAKFTVYCGYKSNDKVIRWFWGCVRSWPVVRRSSLLRFATGTSRLPIDGFRDHTSFPTYHHHQLGI